MGLGGIVFLTRFLSILRFLAYGLCSMGLPIGGRSHVASCRVCDVGVRRVCAVFFVAYIDFSSLDMEKSRLACVKAEKGRDIGSDALYPQKACLK